MLQSSRLAQTCCTLAMLGVWIVMKLGRHQELENEMTFYEVSDWGLWLAWLRFSGNYFSVAAEQKETAATRNSCNSCRCCCRSCCGMQKKMQLARGPNANQHSCINRGRTGKGFVTGSQSLTHRLTAVLCMASHHPMKQGWRLRKPNRFVDQLSQLTLPSSLLS